MSLLGGNSLTILFDSMKRAKSPCNFYRVDVHKIRRVHINFIVLFNGI